MQCVNSVTSEFVILEKWTAASLFRTTVTKDIVCRSTDSVVHDRHQRSNHDVTPSPEKELIQMYGYSAGPALRNSTWLIVDWS